MSFAWGASNGVRDYLLPQVGVESARFHHNHWQPVLLRSLAENVDFCGCAFAHVLPHNWVRWTRGLAIVDDCEVKIVEDLRHLALASAR